MANILFVSFGFLLVVIGFGLNVYVFLNTKDGSFDHFFEPFSVFQASLFNEEGNKYRKYLAYVYALMVLNLLAWFACT